MKVLTNFREYVIYHGEACVVNGIHYHLNGKNIRRV